MARTGGYGTYEGARAAHMETLQWQGIPYGWLRVAALSSERHPGVLGNVQPSSMAKMNYLEKWATGLLSSRSGRLPKAVRVGGSRKAHLGPRMEFARIELLVEPAQAFEVVVAVPTLAPTSEHEQFIEWAIFGFLDVVMLAEPYPIKSVKITVVDAEVDAASSSMMAFRHAGRDAGRQLLELCRAP